MREIKFRVWDIKDKALDFPITLEDLVVGNYPSEILDDSQTPEQFKKGLVWMQYTGIKDKNGKEIYEGDILTGGLDFRKVEFVEEFGGFLLRLKYSKKDINLCEFTVSGTYEIVGNIYENPELLEGNNNVRD